MTKQKMTCPCTECPKQGDVYVCDLCKMTLVIERDCGCDDATCVSLSCCGQAMCKAN